MPKGVLNTRNDISPSSAMMFHSRTQKKLAAWKGDNFRDREITPFKAQLPFLHTQRAVAAAGECHEIATGLCAATISEMPSLATVSSQSIAPETDLCSALRNCHARHISQEPQLPGPSDLSPSGSWSVHQAAGYSSTTTGSPGAAQSLA